MWSVGAGEGKATPVAGAPPEVAALLLRLPDQEGVAEGPPRVEAQPGTRVALVAVIRNHGTVVDNYDLSVDGLPREWWTVAPATVYLTPMRSGRNFEQEVQVYLHPPRTPEAVARPWTFDVVATSRTYCGEVARAGGSLLVLPYREVESKLRPDRASGRLKARFALTVHNRANAPADVALDATDTDSECRFRFAEPSVTLHPGQGVEAPFTVFPPKQILLGRARERHIQVSAVPAEADKPPPPQSAIYRQRPWLPWWLAIVAPIVVVAVILLVLLLPRHTTVPNLTRAGSVFAAEKLLNETGLKLSAKPPEQVSAPGAKPGTIVGQTPAAGKHVKKGSEVTIVLAAGSGVAKVPSLLGETPAAAYTTLEGLGLTLGAISPQPVNPAGVIASSIPAAGTSAPVGTAVSVFLATSPDLAKKLALGKGAGAAAVLAAQRAAAKLAGAKHSVKIPTLSGTPSVAAARLSQLGLVPVLTERFSSQPAHTLIGSEPPAGTSVSPGSTVKLVVSSGPPEVAVDNGSQVQIVDVASGKVVKATPPFAAGELEASWSPDGTHLVFVRGNQLYLAEPNGSGWRESELTPPSGEARDPAFAPQGGSHAVAYIERKGSQPRLCFATIGIGPLAPQCTTPPAGWEIGHQVVWSPDGHSILVFGSGPRRGRNRRRAGKRGRTRGGNLTRPHPARGDRKLRRARLSAVPHERRRLHAREGHAAARRSL
jgi:beta-lactam-binding protein with PASTA domain